MATTINGWPVLDAGSKLLGRIKPAGINRTFTVRVDLDGADLGRLFAALILDWHNEVQKVDVGQLDDWSWSPLRTGRASRSISDHCGGMAIDLNALKAGSQSKTSKAIGMGWLVATGKYKNVKEIMKRYPIFEWGGASRAFGVNTGGAYNNFWDPMHWVVKRGTTAAQVRALIRALGIQPDGTRNKRAAAEAMVEDIKKSERPVIRESVPFIKPIDVAYLSRGSERVRMVQRALVKAGIAVKVDGDYGPSTRAAVEKFQKAQGWTGASADGIVGVETLRRLAALTKEFKA